MEAGFSRMNCLTVIQTSQGLAQYLLDTNNEARGMGIVIGHDARHNSNLFAKHTASVFKSKGFKVYWYEQVVHTPMVAFGTLNLKACAGVMITASHNPAMDNGYKVYGADGCQINSPEDQLIAASILQNLEPITWDITEGSPLIENYLDHKIYFTSNGKMESYEDGQQNAYLGDLMLMTSQRGRRNPFPRFMYTPLHGVGHYWMQRALESFVNHRPLLGTVRVRSKPVPRDWDSTYGPEAYEYPEDERVENFFFVVEEQIKPDPDFPTVKYPNPEEKGTLDLAMATADKHGINLIIANDPDADRLAVAEKFNGKWHQFTGDQVGTLLGYYIHAKRAREDSPLPHKMVVSAVSSQMLAEISKEEPSMTVEECLTGFKWLGKRAQQIGWDNCSFGYEEALGYMIPSVCFDKDGIAAAIVFLQMCAEAGSPYGNLQTLYRRFGYFVTLNTYWRSPNAQKTAAVFYKIRRLSGTGSKSPKTIGVYRVIRFRDLEDNWDYGRPHYGPGRPSTKPELPTYTGVEMITFWLEAAGISKGIRFTVRASGTEPKIKGEWIWDLQFSRRCECC